MQRNHEIGTFLLRLMLGITFFAHGMSKFQGGIENTAGFFASLGIPGFMAYVVAIIELIGGIAMVAGIGTRIVSALFAVILIVATLLVKLPDGFLGGYELDIVLLVVSLHLALNGSALYSVDSKLPFLKKKKHSINA
ncbi:MULTISPECIES: DoxX family protein [Bacillus]|uniref:Oxidoreductase n=2 Tax=Bacillus TaxID=1386 RepID=A0A0M4FRG3_9BACI|nr:MULTISPECIES: DoxX family protein [Bacillus]ALC80330.1 oxidoreductase [Bacillus gobiensis]MBP1083829.1 putative membrane protein YphA (DoxX/SURF4 family) [Bacillus capparidis]MED1098312.1 DoxX family protein [Bacillus capparidis]